MMRYSMVYVLSYICDSYSFPTIRCTLDSNVKELYLVPSYRSYGMTSIMLKEKALFQLFE